MILLLSTRYMLHLPELGMTGILGPPSPFFPPPPRCLTVQCSIAPLMWSPLSAPLGPYWTYQGKPSAPYVAWRNWQSMGLLIWYLLWLDRHLH